MATTRSKKLGPPYRAPNYVVPFTPDEIHVVYNVFWSVGRLFLLPPELQRLMEERVWE